MLLSRIKDFNIKIFYHFLSILTHNIRNIFLINPDLKLVIVEHSIYPLLTVLSSLDIGNSSIQVFHKIEQPIHSIISL